MEKKKTFETVRNKHGVEIRKCCASCQFRLVEEGKRICVLQQKRVLMKHVCEDWKLGYRMEMAGNSGGHIKRGEYLKYVHEMRMQEQEEIEMGDMAEEEQLSVEAIGRAFELSFRKSPYMGI